jgi:general secretion pathway protein A
MYLRFFHLREQPFSMGSHERFFYESENHAEALANMLYTIRHRKGMVLITGEIGSGKTFLGSMLARRLGPKVEAAMVYNPPASPRQLVRAVAEGFGVPDVSAEDDKLALTTRLEQWLEDAYVRGRLAALILDEAQSLPDDALEEVRFLWNWERDGQRLLQIALIGQPDLRQRLQRPQWEAFQQRIVLSYHLGPLGPMDTVRYILHRRKTAAYNGSPLRFTRRALGYIHAASQGIPRLVNILCDNALLLAYARNETKITSAMVAKVLREMTCWPVSAPEPEQGPSDRT